MTREGIPALAARQWSYIATATPGRASSNAVAGRLIFRGETARRFTQDSPSCPASIRREAVESKLARLDLLLTPHRDASAAG
jgi:hypothetical protein